MKLLVSIFCFVLVCPLGTTSIDAQQKRKVVKPKPNFTGTWLLDTAKSNVGSPATSDQPIKISHHDPEFRLTRKVVSNGQVTSREFVYYTDGRGETNSMVFLSTGTDINRQGPDKDVIKSKTTWSSNKLVARQTVRSLIGGQQLEFEIIDEWKFSSDGKELTQSSRAVFRQDMSGPIFVPTTRGDIKLVYNRLPD